MTKAFQVIVSLFELKVTGWEPGKDRNLSHYINVDSLAEPDLPTGQKMVKYLIHLLTFLYV